MSAIYTERLFLCKHHNPQIYVDNSEHLTNDQIIGIRFLFAKFKKDIPGVILISNGNNLQKVVVCFLQAIQVLLTKPILIICSGDDNLQNWKNLFPSWMDNDLVLQSCNPFIKKKVFINTIKDLPMLSKQNWSIVIVEDNSFSKEIFRVEIKATYKIWLVSLDLKRDLQSLFKIYSWLYPKEEKIEIQRFVPSNTISDKINKTILLNTFFEDILMSNSPWPDSSKERIALKAKINVTTREKLKDITRKKIKCSKRQFNDDDLQLLHDNIDNQESKSKADNAPTLSTDTINKSSNTSQFTNRMENTLSVTTISEDMEVTAIAVHNSQDHLASEDDCMESQCLNFETALQDLVESAASQSDIILSQDITLKMQTPDLAHKEKDAKNVLNNNFQIASNEQNNKTIIESLIEEKVNEHCKTPVNESSSSLEFKLRELEEKALKKFKGSFLDSIF